MNRLTSKIFTVLNKQEGAKLIWLIVFDMVIGVLDIAFLALLLVIINFYTKNTALPKMTLLPGALTDPHSLCLIGVFLVVFAIKNAIGFLGMRSQHHFFYNVASRLSKRNILNYLKDSYTNFVSVDSSVQIRKISQQPIEFSHYILINFQQVVSQVILIFFTVCTVLIYHPSLFLLLLVLLMPPVVLLGWFIRNRSKKIRANVKVAAEKTLQHLQESLSGYIESNIYGKEGFFSERYHGYQRQLNENIATQQTLQALPSRLIEVFAVFGFFILVAINKWSADEPTTDLLTIGIFMAAAYKIIPGIVKILNCTGQIKTYQFVLDDLLDKAKPGPTVSDRPPLPIRSVKFEQVYFKYQDHNVLNDLSFRIEGGDLAGISGHSGKGKTTVINLLLGLLSPGAGAIYINDKEIDSAGRQLYLNKISYVKQQQFFIHDTILKNITLSDDGYDAERLKWVLAFCGIDKLTDTWPEGMEKMISENGKNISGGQRQRIMLARALYHNFDLLILDEPFSELDQASEHVLLNNLQALAGQGKMIIFITHNQAGLNFCNKIFYINGE